MLPTHFPPHQTVYRWFIRFRDDGTWESPNHHLVTLDRQRAGSEASPTAAVIDTQSVKSTEAGGPRGYDAGKKVTGRKQHALGRHRRPRAGVAGAPCIRAGPRRCTLDAERLTGPHPDGVCRQPDRACRWRRESAQIRR